jgi:hypothetical protein
MGVSLGDRSLRLKNTTDIIGQKCVTVPEEDSLIRSKTLEKHVLLLLFRNVMRFDGTRLVEIMSIRST